MNSAAPVALISGGNSGIGKTVLHKLNNAGFRALGCDIVVRDEVPVDAEQPGMLFKTDLTRPEEIDRLYDEVTGAVGSPEILICNAGRGIHESLVKGDPDLWEEVFRLNVFGTFRLVRAFVPPMLSSGRGDVVFISSVAAAHAYPGGGIYSASKAAVDQLAETLRLEVQPEIRVTVIHPGVVDTPFFENMIHAEQSVESIGWGALAADDVAESVLYAITRPRGVALNNIVIRPAGQPM